MTINKYTQTSMSYQIRVQRNWRSQFRETRLRIPMPLQYPVFHCKHLPEKRKGKKKVNIFKIPSSLQKSNHICYMKIKSPICKTNNNNFNKKNQNHPRLSILKSHMKTDRAQISSIVIIIIMSYWICYNLGEEINIIYTKNKNKLQLHLSFWKFISYLPRWE